MKNKRIIISIFLLIVILSVTVLTIASCQLSNYQMWDINFEYNFVVINENGQQVLHKIEVWHINENGCVQLKLSCCNNHVFTSDKIAILYEQKPSEYAFDFECSLGK